MTYCSFNVVLGTNNTYKDRVDRQQDAALDNSRVYFDDWTAARPSREWPARIEVHSFERPTTDQGAVALPMMSAAPTLPTEAQVEGRATVHGQCASEDILGSPDRLQPVDEPSSEPAGCRRRHKRLDGPFDGLRVGLLETPVQLYDLSRGGCFINSMHQQQPGVPLLLKIDLPYEGWITVNAETLYRRGEFGFAVRFTEISDEASARLERSLEALERWAEQR